MIASSRGVRRSLGATLLLAGIGVLELGCAIEGTDAATGAGGGSSCARATLPPPPTIESGPSTEDTWLAWRVVRFDAAMDGGPLGLDLDGRCTCQGEAPACLPPEGAEPVCDLLEGRDNAAGDFAAKAALRLGIPSLGELFTQAAQTGNATLLVRLTGYDGAQSDDQVTVRVYGSAGFGGAVPTFTQNDAWPIDASYLEAPADDVEKARYRYDAAYVTEGQLVAFIPELPVIARNLNMRSAFPLSGALLTGKLVPDGGGYRLERGLLAARVGQAAALGAIGELCDFNGLPVCTNDADYAALKSTVCERRDLFLSSGGPTKPCDALSFALAFEAEPAGAAATPSPAPPPGTSCDAMSLPANDACD